MKQLTACLWKDRNNLFSLDDQAPKLFLDENVNTCVAHGTKRYFRADCHQHEERLKSLVETKQTFSHCFQLESLFSWTLSSSILSSAFKFWVTHKARCTECPLVDQQPAVMFDSCLNNTARRSWRYVTKVSQSQQCLVCQNNLINFLSFLIA